MLTLCCFMFSYHFYGTVCPILTHRDDDKLTLNFGNQPHIYAGEHHRRDLLSSGRYSAYIGSHRRFGTVRVSRNVGT
jgi:hypothetical protein